MKELTGLTQKNRDLLIANFEHVLASGEPSTRFPPENDAPELGQ